MPMTENKARSLRGELYHAFSPDMIAERRRSAAARDRYNNAGDISRRDRVKLWRDITADNTPLPPLDPSLTPEEDEALFVDEPWVEPPILFDYGTNIVLGPGVFLNVNTTIIDTCKVYIGARTMFGPNVSLYSGCHPLDPELRNGLKGPEFGKEIHVGEDCWIGGCAIILPGVKVGKGCVIGAGSVVTKDVPDYTVVAGNPARKIKDVPRNTISEEERLRVLDIAMSGVEAKE